MMLPGSSAPAIRQHSSGAGSLTIACVDEVANYCRTSGPTNKQPPVYPLSA